MSAVPELDAKTLRRIVLGLPERLPITDEFEAGDRAERARKSVPYRSQRELIERWLAEYDAPGYCSRRKPGGSAKNFCNRFKCAGRLIWLAEAVGISKEGTSLRSRGRAQRATKRGSRMRRIPAGDPVVGA